MFRSALVTGLVALAACNPGKKSYEACLEWIDSLDCGSYDFASAGLDASYCDAYEESECDVSEYFDCLIADSKCEGDVYTMAPSCEVPSCE